MAHSLRNAIFAGELAAGAASVLAAETIFDPNRDPAKDLKAAEARAAKEHKRILLDIGGNWCEWCHLLDRAFRTDTLLKAELEKDYILVHVNFSPENENRAFLAKFPSIGGYPDLIVLSADGSLLCDEDTSELEADHTPEHGYDDVAILAFLKKWAPGAE